MCMSICVSIRQNELCSNTNRTTKQMLYMQPSLPQLMNERSIEKKIRQPPNTILCVLLVHTYKTYINVYTYINGQYTVQLTCKICKCACIIITCPNTFYLIRIPYIENI